MIPSGPLVTSYQFSKIILRISGYPKMNIFRKLFWKIFSKKIYAITCPTNKTKEFIVDQNIFEKNKIFTLRDPIINMNEFAYKKKEILNFKDLKKDNYILSIGRLTKQKNFSLLIRSFSEIIKTNQNIHYL